MSLRWTEDDYSAYQDRLREQRNAAPSLESIAMSHGLPGPKKNKYGNRKVKVGGMTFDSKKEYARWEQLQMMQQAGKIEGLERQKAFELAPAVMLGGRRKPALKYNADFIYYENGELVVEDTKSAATCQDSTFRIKKHLMASVHGIEIRET